MSALCRHVCIAPPGKHRPIFRSDLAAPAIATRRDRLWSHLFSAGPRLSVLLLPQQ